MSSVLDQFFSHHFRTHPVNATFTGIHEHDSRLPDWSSAGLDRLDDERRALHAALAHAHPSPSSANGYRTNTDSLDAELARGQLEIAVAEGRCQHGAGGNPALWTGEAIFSLISLMIRPFAPLGDRIGSAISRCTAMPQFLGDARTTMDARGAPTAWTARAIRECEGAAILLSRGVDAWIASDANGSAGAARLRGAADGALAAFEEFAAWLRAQPVLADDCASCGADHFDLLLHRGHHYIGTRSDLLADARAQLLVEQDRLATMAQAHGGSWSEAKERLSAHHPAPSDYLTAFTRVWEASHDCAATNNVVTWPDWPIRYTLIPEWTRDAAPYLYYLFYRAPAPFDNGVAAEYVVPPVPADGAEQHLRTWNFSAIKLNHVVHHGGIGHHVQNWHAYHQATSRVGAVAAVDCASRIGMFCGGTMAEGWACYATALMDELGFLSPLEQLSEQHSRVRFLVRAIVDISFHEGTMTFDDAVRFHADEAMLDDGAARAEVVKCGMFPGTAMMYWLGTRGIHDLRTQMETERGPAFTLSAFHDEVLGQGSIPVPLIARLMTEGVT